MYQPRRSDVLVTAEEGDIGNNSELALFVYVPTGAKAKLPANIELR
jgi:hypothetical protein